MKTILLYVMAFVLLDAFVPAGCRSERPYFEWGYEVSDRTTEIEVTLWPKGTTKRTTYMMDRDSVYVWEENLDTVFAHRVLPFSPERFEAMKQCLIDCEIVEDFKALNAEQRKLLGTEDFDAIYLNLYDSGRLYFQGHYSVCDTLKEYTMNGKMDELKETFLSLMSDN